MNWYYGCSYNLQKKYIWIHIYIWILMVSVHTTNPQTFEFILMYELILWSFIQLTNKGRMNSYMYMNSYDGRSYNQSVDIWIHNNVWIDIMAVYTTYTQRTYEFIQVYEYMYGHLYNLSTYIWIHINVRIDIMSVHTTLMQNSQQTYEFLCP